MTDDALAGSGISTLTIGEIKPPVCEWDSQLGKETNSWSRDNVSELLPHVLTPLAASWLQHMDYFAEREWVAWAGATDLFPIAPPPQSSFFGIFAGRAYINWGWCADVVASWQVDESTMLDKWARANDFIARTRDPARAQRARARVERSWRHLRQRIEADFKRVQRLHERIEMAASVGDPKQLRRLLMQSVVQAGHAFSSHQISTSATGETLDQLERTLDEGLGQHREDLSSLLASAAGQVESAAPGHWLWRLSRQVLRRPELARGIQRSSIGQLYQMLEQPSTGDIRWFAKRVGEVRSRFWYRGEAELDLYEEDWGEDASFVLGVVKSLLETPEAQSPAARERAASTRRSALEKETVSQLPSHLAKQTSRLVGEGRDYVRFQELTKANWVRSHRLGRRLGLLLGQGMQRKGLLDKTADVFFLNLTELLDGNGPDILESIERRKKVYRELSEVEVPFAFQEKLDVHRKASKQEVASRVYKGLGVSGGTAEGPVRRVFTAKAAVEVEFRPGEVLVAPYTDAAWTPLFISAAAIVTEVGSILSHAAIVAREYGVPAVAAVKGATTVLQDGVRVKVDGDCGTVSVLE
ncbi:MAG: PEP-utilizing enzyme [Dehalococcoidia bacterium]